MKKINLFLIAFLAISISAFSQFQLNTVPPLNGGNGSAGITFGVSSNQTVIIDTIFGSFSTAGLTDVWYTTTNVSGPPNMSVAGGWTQIGQATIPVASGTGSIVPIPLSIGITLLPGVNYRFFVNGSLGAACVYSGTGTSLPAPLGTFTDGVLTIETGELIGYGGSAPTSMSNHPRQFNGGIRYTTLGGMNDAAVLSIDSPTVYCAGPQPVYATIANFGGNQINSVDVNWEVNGVVQTPVSYTNLLDTLNGLFPNTVQINLGTYTFPSGLSNLKVYTSMPNRVADTSNFNDTMSMVTGPALNGVFTVNSASPTAGLNFNSFSDLTTALNTFGACGPITVNVAPNSGPYNEQVNFKNIPGASAANTISINGNGNTLQFASTNTNERAVLTFDGASYITVDSLYIDGSAGTYGFGIQNFGGAHHITIQNCTVDMGITSTSSNFAGIVNSGTKTSATASGGTMHHITIDNCKIIGGYYGITSYGATANTAQRNIVITNNVFEDVYYYTTYFLYTDSVLIEGNDISRPNRTAVSTMYGLYFSTGNKNIIINANAIHNTHGSATSLTGTVYPIYFSSDAPMGEENYITNNLIYDINCNGTVYAIYDLGADGTHYINNTVSLDHTASTGGITRGFFQSTTSTNSSFVNNLITISRGGSGIKYGIYLPATTSMMIDYNNVYLNSTGTGAIYYGYSGSNQTTLNDWQTNTSYGANSYDVDPKYNNLPAFDLAPSSGLINSVGLPHTMVTTDYFGVTRAAIPDLGAIEFNPPASNNLGFASLSSPIVSADSCYGATEDVIVQLINAGGLPLDFSVDNATITMNVTGAATQILTVNLNNNTANGGSPLAIGTVIDINMGTINMTTAGTYNFDGLITMVTDTFPQNDTLNDIQVLFPVSGGAISGSDTICSGDTVTLATLGYQGTLQWQILNGSTWINIPGETNSSIDISPLTSTDYRVMACGTMPSNTKTVVAVVIPLPTVTSNNAIVQCGSAGVDTLIASSTLAGVDFNWYDAAVGGSLVHSGSTYLYTATPGGVGSPSIDTFYVSGATGMGLQNIGAPNNGQAGGYTLEAGLFFDVFASKITINGVYVYPLGTGAGTISIGIKETSTGNIIHSTTVNLVGTTPGIRTYVPLGFTIPAGTDYQMLWLTKTGGVTSLVRDGASAITGGGFPFTIPNVMSITKGNCCSANAISTSYYYFYDWEIGGGCEGDRAMAIGEVNCVVGIDNVDAITSFSLSPNPSTGMFKLNFATMQAETLNLNVRDINGKLVYKDIITISGNYTSDLDFTSFAKGVYFMQIQSGNNSRVEKLIVK